MRSEDQRNHRRSEWLKSRASGGEKGDGVREQDGGSLSPGETGSHGRVLVEDDMI